MIVDCHTHISLGGNILDISELMSAAENVDRCIVLADQVAVQGGSLELNKKLSDYIGRYKNKLVGFGFIDPTTDEISEKAVAAHTRKIGLQGVVLYCAACGFHPCHSRAMQFYEAASKLSLPIFFHNSGHLDSKAVLDYSQPFLLDEVARTYPELKMIIGSMGTPFVEQTLSMVTKHKNVYADLSINPANTWQVYNTIMAAHERNAMDKLLFGSGYPMGKAGVCIETLLGFNKLLGDTSLPAVPRTSLRGIIERDTIELLAIGK